MRTIRIFIAVAAVLMTASLCGAAGWQAKDMGVGIYVYDPSTYDKVLRIVEKKNIWSLKLLNARNAFSQTSGKVFGAWLTGPPVSSYQNKNGVPEYGYTYRLTDPRGNSNIFGPHSFYSPGFTTIGINAWLPGEWKIDFMLWQRSTQSVSPIGTVKFTITD